MSNAEYDLAGSYSLESLPLQDMGAEAVDPVQLMMSAGRGTVFLRDLRRDHEARGRIDGFEIANGIPTGGRTWNQLDADWQAAEANGQHPEAFSAKNVDTSRAALRVRDAHPGELIGEYTDYVADTVLQHWNDHPGYEKLPNKSDAPGTRFISPFAADSDIVAMGKRHRGDMQGSQNTIDNSVYLINRLDGLLPNFPGFDSMGRGQSPTLSYAIECFASAYGKDRDEVVAHYREPLAKNVEFWMRGREQLQQIRHDRGAMYGRQMLLAGRKHDIVFRFGSDTPMGPGLMQGVRPESAAEDEELILRVVGNLTGRARRQRAHKLKRDVEAGCESTQDFADWEFSNYQDLDTIRTTDIAPAFLQANMVHQMRMAGYHQEAKELSEVIMRRFFHRIDDTHAQFADLLRDGTPTKALHATQAYPLLVGGIVPYEAAILLANTWRDALLRPNGVLISVGKADAQWSGNPSEVEDEQQNSFVRRMQARMYGRPMLGGEGDDRSWPSVGMLVSESFTMAAIEAQLNGKDPGPLLEVAEMARVATVSGIEARFNADHYIAEKVSAVDATKFIDGGEYAQTPDKVQKGFGMTIGAHRSLAGRNLAAEVRWPDDYSWRQWTLRHALGDLSMARTITIPVSKRGSQV